MRIGTVATLALLAIPLAPVAFALTLPVDLVPSQPGDLAAAVPGVTLPALPSLGLAKPTTATPGDSVSAADGPLAVLPDDSILVDPATGSLLAPFLPKGYDRAQLPAAGAARAGSPGAEYLGHKRDLPLPTRHAPDANPFDAPRETRVQQAPEPTPRHLARPQARAEPPGGVPTNAPVPPGRAVALTACGAILLLAPLGALYHRFRASENGRRATMLQLLARRPGLTQRDLADELRLDPATVRYHLGRLAKERLATEHDARWFAAGSVAVHDRAAVVARQDAGHVLEIVRAMPGSTKADLARALRVGRSTITWHLRTLHEAGLVRIERAGKTVRVTAA